MMGGGPVYSTTTPVLYVYRLAFEQFDMGYASTVGILWVMVLLGLSAVYIRLIDKDFKAEKGGVVALFEAFS